MRAYGRQGLSDLYRLFIFTMARQVKVQGFPSGFSMFFIHCIFLLSQLFTETVYSDKNKDRVETCPLYIFWIATGRYFCWCEMTIPFRGRQTKPTDDYFSNQAKMSPKIFSLSSSKRISCLSPG